eukprot:4516439-Amphidinium_carterae.1
MTGAPFQVATDHKSLGTTLSAQLRRRTRLQQQRQKQAAKRRRRLVRLRKAKAHIGPVLRAGPTAVATWGATQGFSPGRLHTLRQQQLRAETPLPARTKTELYWVVRNAAADPAAVHHQQLFSAFWHVLRGEFFTEEELGTTFAWAAGRLRRAVNPWGRVCGPAHAIIMTAVRLGFEAHTVKSWQLEGMAIDLDSEGLHRVQQLTAQATIRWSLNKGLDTDTPLLWQPVAEAAKKLPPLEAKMARLQFAHGVWCAANLHQRAATDPRCMLCGQQGTISHRVLYCPAYATLRSRYLTQEDERIYRSMPEHEAEEVAHMHVRPARHAEAHASWSLGELIQTEPRFYTDGSGCHQHRSAKLAAWAYVQLSSAGEPLAVAAGALAGPPAFEGSVYEAELRAVAAVLQHTTWDVHIGSDNAAVIQGWRQGPHGIASTRGKYASVWRNIWEQVAHRQVLLYKVKAHLQGPTDQQDYLDWRGNDLADHYAKLRLAEAKQASGTHQQMVITEDRLTRLTNWVGYQGALLARQDYVDMPDLESVEWKDTRIPTSRATRWTPPPWLGRLEGLFPEMSAIRPKTERGSAVEVIAKPSVKGAEGARRHGVTKVTQDRFGPGHDIRAYQVRPQRSTLFWCHICGAYASKAVSTLRYRCPGSRQPGTAAACSRITRGVHPQHALSSTGAYLEPVEFPLHEDPDGQDPVIPMPSRERPTWLL